LPLVVRARRLPLVVRARCLPLVVRAKLKARFEVHPLAMNSDEQPDTLAALIAASHNAQLATEHGMVTQIWNDGEITLQKGGDLLWHRSLHQHYPPLPGVDVSMPLRYATNSYAFVSDKDALRIRIAIRNRALEALRTTLEQ